MIINHQNDDIYMKLKKSRKSKKQTAVKKSKRQQNFSFFYKKNKSN